jgi:hypothetical protein
MGVLTMHRHIREPYMYINGKQKRTNMIFSWNKQDSCINYIQVINGET